MAGIDEFKMFPTEVIKAFSHGQIAAVSSASAQQIVTVTTPLQHGVALVAASGNIGNIYVGSDSALASSNGMPLSPNGLPGLSLEIDDLSKVWVRGDAAGQKLAWIAD